MDGRPSLLDLFVELDRHGGPIPHDALRRLLDRRAFDLDRIREVIAFDDRAYRRISIRRRRDYEALLLCWRSGQSSPIHNHAGSACAVRVLEGVATETTYAMRPCGRIAPTGSREIPAGRSVACRGEHIHQLANLGPTGNDLVTLHVYSPPPGGWRTFPLEQTTLADHDELIRRGPETVALDWPSMFPVPNLS